ncbi:hypothetical protein K501DRAFT_265076 [Backusella circina FSU 941]|nr:hypothetical protein K501DRAFT_265076 [Backusella circina FSU 941]
MRLSVISTILTLALSAKVAALNKRDPSTSTQLCISDLTSTTVQLTTVTNSVNAYTSSSGYAGGLAIQNQEQTLESRITTAGTDCCSITTISNDDIDAILSETDSLTPQFIAALDSIVDKKPVFDSVPIIAGLIKNDINVLHTKTGVLIDCLVDITQSMLPDFATEIEAAFQRAMDAYA